MALTPLATWTGRGIVPRSRLGRRRHFSLPASISYPAGQIVGEQVGANAVYTVTLGTQSSGTFALTYGGNTTSGIAYNAAASAVQTALAALAGLAQAAVHVFTLNNSPTGGTFTVSYGGQTTTPLAYNATAAQVQAAMQALSSIGSGNATVAGSAGGPYTVTAAGALVGMPFPSGCFSFYYDELTGAGAAPTVTDAVANAGGGSGANAVVSGSAGGPYTVTFQNALGKQPVTLTATFSALTTPGNASIASATAGSAGTLGKVTAYASSNTDGSQTPIGVLEFPCSTDANGEIFLGGSTSPVGLEIGQPTAPVFVEDADFITGQLSGSTPRRCSTSPAGG